MRFTKAFTAYNDRRYSKPWIARIATWKVGQRPELVWGNYLGNSMGGECEIACQAGDLLRYGQKDNRGNSTQAQYAIALENGQALEISEVNAAHYFHATDRAAILLEFQQQVEKLRELQSQEDAWLDAERAADANFCSKSHSDKSYEFRQAKKALAL
jgi:hypothetical protein